MRVLGYDETVAALEFPPLVEALRQAFRKTDFETPSADLHSLAVPGEPTGSLIVLPAWLPGKNFGVRLTTNFPGNAARSKPVRGGGYILGDGSTGEMLAIFDGPALTLRRTAAASALAATYLARAESERMLMIGTGALAAASHRRACQRAADPQRAGLGPRSGKAARLAQRMTRRNLKVEAAADLEKAVRARISSAAPRRHASRSSKARGCPKACMSISSAGARRRCARPMTR